MMNASTVAQHLGLSRRAVYDLADRGILPCYRLCAFNVGCGGPQLWSEA